MTLDDLVDTLRRDILHDNSDRVSGDSDQLWTDTSLVRYIDQAQRRFARRSFCIRDGSSSVTRFTTAPYQQDYTLDPSILSVLSMRSLGNGAWIGGVFTPGTYDTSNPPVFTPSGLGPVYPDSADLGRVGHADRRQYRPDIEWASYDVDGSSRMRPGKPTCYETDETMGESSGSAGVVSARLYPIPDNVYFGCVMQMRVVRLPLIRLTPADMSAVPEIPEDYHVDMLDWAAYLALRVVDHEAGDAARAQEFRQSFEAHAEEARLEIERKTFAPTRWGFGRPGMIYTGN